jgi:hypothetical protein
MPNRVASALAPAVRTLLCVALLAVSGCGGKPSTPEALFEKVAAYNLAGETGKIWDLMTDDARQKFKDGIEGYRTWLRRNPDPNEKLTRQYKCTRDEFMVLSYPELFRRENLGNERALVDAKIVDRSPDPRKPGEEVLTIPTPGGPRVYMRVRNEQGGWALVEFMVEAKANR